MKSLFQFNSIQSKLVLSVGLILVIIGGIIIAYTSITSQNAAIASAKEITLGEASTASADVKAQIEVAMDASRTLAQALATVKDPSNTTKFTRAQVNALLREVLDHNPNFLGMYTVWEPNAFDGQDARYVNTPESDATGRFIPYWVRGSDGTVEVVPLVDYETEGLGEYYLCPKRTKNECMIDPYTYEIDGEMVLLTSTTVPIIYEGVFYGMVGADLKLDFLQSQVDKVDLYNHTAQMVIISNNGTIAAVTGDDSWKGKPLSEMQADYEEDTRKVQAGNPDVSFEGDKLQTLTPIFIGNTTTPWAAQLMIPMKEVTREATQQLMLTLAISIGMMVLGLVGLWFVIGGLVTRPIRVITSGAKRLAVGDAELHGIDRVESGKIDTRNDELGEIGRAFTDIIRYYKDMTGHAQMIAAGDLTVCVEPRGESDLLGNTFVQMVASLRESVGDVAQSAVNLSVASDELARAANQAEQATNQISMTIQQIAAGTSEQAGAVTKTAGAVEKMTMAIDGVAKGAHEQSVSVGTVSTATSQINLAIQQVAGNATAVTTDSAAAAEAARKGSLTVEQTLAGMQSIKTKVGVSAEKVQAMGRRSREIGNIVETIEDIATQTNLLALNAAIEAARAGEHGKGFAIVADEVRKLAERSSLATKEIGSMISEILSTVADAVKAMEEGNKEVERGVNSANAAGVALTEILSAAEAVKKQATLAGDASKRMRQASEELVAAVDSVSAIVETNTASTADMSANSSEVTHAIDSIASVSEENSAALQEVSASTEEMSAQVEEVTAAAQSLAEMAQALQAVVGRFRLD